MSTRAHFISWVFCSQLKTHGPVTVLFLLLCLTSCQPARYCLPDATYHTPIAGTRRPVHLRASTHLATTPGSGSFAPWHPLDKAYIITSPLDTSLRSDTEILRPFGRSLGPVHGPLRRLPSIVASPRQVFHAGTWSEPAPPFQGPGLCGRPKWNVITYTHVLMAAARRAQDGPARIITILDVQEKTGPWFPRLRRVPGGVCAPARGITSIVRGLMRIEGP